MRILPIHIYSILFFLFFVATNTAYAQCTNKGSLYPSSATCIGVNTTAVDISMGCNNAGEYAMANGLVPGETYIAETCGDPDFDTYLTVFEGGTTNVLGFNDDACARQSSVTFTAPASGTVDVGLREYLFASDPACGCLIEIFGTCFFYNFCDLTCSTTNNTCMTIRVRKASAFSTPPPTGPSSGCPSVTLSRPAPPSNLTYYWQNSPTGTSTANSGSTFTVTADGTYYLRARDNCGGWADISSGLTVDITDNTYYEDADGDGFGNPSVTTVACTPPAGYIADNTDCDDSDANEFPGQMWYLDADNDGYSDGSSQTACNRPTNYRTSGELTATSGDCNDSDAGINPGSSDLCVDGIDQNCDGTDGAAPTAIATSASATSSCTLNGLNAWVPIVYASDGSAIVEINDNGNNLGDVTASLLSVGSASPSNVCSGGLGSFMGRTFQITSSNTSWFGNTVSVRFYFTASELSSLITEAGCGDPNGCADDDDVCTINDIQCTKYPTGTGPGGSGGVFLSQTGNGTGYGANYVAFDVTEFSDFYLHGSESGTVLPVEFLRFEASALENQHIRLDWATASELNNAGFQVQRSTDGIDFEAIGFVEGHGTTQDVKTYGFNDRDVEQGLRYYYRLLQQDFDGTSEYSKVVSARIGGTSELADLQLIPNPATDVVTVQYRGIHSTGQSAQIVLTDMMGRTVYSQPAEIRNQQIEERIFLNSLRAGAYVVSVIIDGETVNKRLVVGK